MQTKDFDYVLPGSLIAQNPVVPRDSSRLMVVDTGSAKVFHRYFSDLPEYLHKDDVLVLNNSKVIPARLNFNVNKEVFLLKNCGKNRWRVLVRPGRFFKLGKKFDLNGVNAVIEKVFDDGSRIIQFSEDVLELGETPLPPYISESVADDSQYQTVYAEYDGSVAAPTAGLHFTTELIDRLKGGGVEFTKVTLHVGRGTFLPVSSDNLADHVMHFEEYEMSEESAGILNSAKKKGARVVAVGTTSVRVLESCYEDGFEAAFGETDVFIYPGKYKWKSVDSLITNFHLPKSTLLMLVASFLENKGVRNPVDKVKELYALAISEEYRFYSFGDAMLII